MTEPDNTIEVRVPLRKLTDAVGRQEHAEHFDLQSVDLDADDVVVEIEKPVGKCPACGSFTVGTTAWNSAHDRMYVCRNDECEVDRHHNEVVREGGD